ncbi:hypothetical protein ISR94_00770 [Candidatus Microgenomates bacterium]|nr:hypothetical protein [Candidatus Microgenomates bacterium]
MTVENNLRETKPDDLRDKVVRFFTRSKYGVEVVIEHGLMDETTGEVFQGSPKERAAKTDNIVVVLGKSKTEHVKRKIVKIK